MTPANLASRRYDVAEYFFGEEATEHLDLVEAAVDHVYADHHDTEVREAFKRYLRGDRLTFSTGICESLTAGFGECNHYGYFEYPMPSNFVEKFLRGRSHGK
jgi:hypothetical protein